MTTVPDTSPICQKNPIPLFEVPNNWTYRNQKRIISLYISLFSIWYEEQQMTKSLRVRFAPAPTGMMHLGNIRTALMNYLMAQQKNGTFVLRIEDTDPERNFDPGAKKIIEDLTWLGIDYNEGPIKGGNFGPYFQSERTEIYEKKLKELIEKEKAYRCFCTSEELDKKRERQIALKRPPRYDRTCLKLSLEESESKAQTEPFIWRMKLNHNKKLTIKDLSHNEVTFDLNNFSDFPITRQNGSVTFMFANFVDDAAMEISCAVRGEDHLSNTAGQAALYDAFELPFPTFWHLPILCNIDGKKLSKRDFGFSLRDLKDAGFLPEAILNYLAIIGASFKNEIMSVQDLIKELNFDSPSTTGQIKYDVEKLRWVNHKWICQTPTKKIAQLCRPYLEKSFTQVKTMNEAQLTELIGHIQKEMVTLQESVQLLAFYFGQPDYSIDIARTLVPADQLDTAKKVLKAVTQSKDTQSFVDTLGAELKQTGIKPKALFSLVRYALMASTNGPSIKELVGMLGIEESQKRIGLILSLI